MAPLWHLTAPTRHSGNFFFHVPNSPLWCGLLFFHVPSNPLWWNVILPSPILELQHAPSTPLSPL
jgi:hypothetical protein